MDNGSQHIMTLQRMQYGGFVVISGRSPNDYGAPAMAVFAATTIDDALNFMRDKISPIGGAQTPAHAD